MNCFSFNYVAMSVNNTLLYLCLVFNILVVEVAIACRADGYQQDAVIWVSTWSSVLLHTYLHMNI